MWKIIEEMEKQVIKGAYNFVIGAGSVFAGKTAYDACCYFYKKHQIKKRKERIEKLKK